MKNFIIKLAHMEWLKIAALAAALISGADDLIEFYFGIHDLFHLDVAHGVVATALTGVLEPLAKLFEQTEKSLEHRASRAD